MKKCPYCGKEYPEDAQVCVFDQETLVPVGTSASSPADPRPMITDHASGSLSAPWRPKLNANVRFENPAQGTPFKSQNLGFQGRGSIEVGTESVVVSGKQRRFFSFGRKATVELPFSEILNVQRHGRQIGFALTLSEAEEKSKGFSFTAETDEEAGQIESFLPRTRTAEFAQAQAEQQEFGARLRAATPHVFITPAIVAINVLVFVAMALAGAGVMGDLHPEVHMQWGANFGPLTTDGQWWRLLTSTFLHFGILHLACNMWALYATGQMVERLYGNAFFLVLYLTGGVTGSVASVLWNPKVLSAGASGAIFGVYGALLAYLLLQRKSVPASIVGPLRNSAMAFTAYNLFFGATQAGIDNAAHLGGLLGGGIAGLILARPLDVDARGTIALSRIFARMAVPVLIPIFLWLPVKNSGKPYQQEQRFQADFGWFIDEEKSILSDWETVRKKIQAGSIGEVEAARMLEPAAARWEKAYERLSQAELEEQTPSSERRASVLKYVGLRRDAMKALIPAIRTGDPTKLEEFKVLQSKAGKALEELNSMLKQR